MDRFIADLHIHSRFSRATSKNLTLKNLAAWSRVKGIDVLGTGDFTHPEWVEEMEEQLVQDETGLYVLKDTAGVEDEIVGLEGPLSGTTRFMLQTEISSIYKRGGKVRKVHNLVYLPDLETVKKFNEKLAQVGNLASDGRPILGLDSHDLLEMVLETHPLAFLIPAHIWTPWFSLFGSKSGFDTVEECYGDLSKHIFAMETGLSSDPEMNWTWSALDRYRMVSNSDAHSGEKLGREANLFSGDISYEGVFRALRGEGLGHKFLGTLEFFPEEGKYHMDGHRKCGIIMDPAETRDRGGLCPVCGKPVTRGVMARVADLADRDQPVQPTGQPGFSSLIPLKEVIGEVVGTGPGSKKVHKLYTRLIGEFGSEFNVLTRVPPEDVKRVNGHMAEGLARMREGQVLRQPGYDGEYGVISVFTPKEREQIKHGQTLVDMPVPDPPAPGPSDEKPRRRMAVRVPPKKADEERIRPNKAQIKAIQAGPGPVLVVAGPGTGKTQTLMGRVRSLLEDEVKPRRILCLTFTRRAAVELRERLMSVCGLEEDAPLPQAGTLHSLAFEYWKHVYGESPVVLDEATAKRIFSEASGGLTGKALDRAWNELSLARETLAPEPEDLAEAANRYAKQKHSWNLVDYTDLLEFLLEQTGSKKFQRIYHHILVDEVQDLTPLQIALVTALCPQDGRGFFAIGDPEQSIYGFRGAAGDADQLLKKRWPKLERVTLTENYRSGQNVLDGSRALFPDGDPLKAARKEPGRVHVFTAPDDRREASWIAERIKRLIGATSHSLTDAAGSGEYTPGDVAVLVRFKGLIPVIEKGLTRFGVPCATPEVEAFWNEPRVASILKGAARILGASCVGDDECLDFPENVLAGGLPALQHYLAEAEGFDDYFWQSRAFKRFCDEYGRRDGWTGLLNWVNLQSDLELVRKSAEKVQVMSLHAAKGLEFDAVFLPALEEGVLPFAGTDFLSGKMIKDGSMDVAEERRLLYVGMTRARRELFISHSRSRNIYGKTLTPQPSRFLADIPAELVTRSTLAAKKVEKQRQISLLD